MSTELIFNKVRGSFVDGWGIRTTIFLKGCPLKCKWCCNPEGQSLKPELRIYYDKCNGCGTCVDACPHHALSIVDGKVSCDRTLCKGCGKCNSSCAYEALDVFGTPWSAQEMFEYVRKDKAFYDSTGGGVTIGGGEASLFPEFCIELIDLCHGEGIPVAIDTCGYAATEKNVAALEHADLLLYDIKGIDDAQHIEDTGVSNEIIWKNLYHLNEIGKDIIIRVPVIPGHNGDDETLNEIASRISKLASVKRVDLICYHKYGMTKYRELDKEYPLGDTVSTIPEDRQQEILNIFLSYGLKAQLGG